MKKERLWQNLGMQLFWNLLLKKIKYVVSKINFMSFSLVTSIFSFSRHLTCHFNPACLTFMLAAPIRNVVVNKPSMFDRQILCGHPNC